MLRKILRTRAKSKMQEKGLKQLCKKSGKAARKHTSYFANHWRDYI